MAADAPDVIARYRGSLILDDGSKSSGYALIELDPRDNIPKPQEIYELFKRQAWHFDLPFDWMKGRKFSSYPVADTDLFDDKGRFLAIFRFKNRLTWFVYSVKQKSYIYFPLPYSGKVFWYDPESEDLRYIDSKENKAVGYNVLISEWKTYLANSQKVFQETGVYGSGLSDPYLERPDKSDWFLYRSKGYYKNPAVNGEHSLLKHKDGHQYIRGLGTDACFSESYVDDDGEIGIRPRMILITKH